MVCLTFLFLFFKPEAFACGPQICGRTPWRASYGEALSVSHQSGKFVLLAFTGSDWNEGSRCLERELFEDEDFTSYASRVLVAVRIDFPQQELLSHEQWLENRMLAAQYQIKSYPTLILLDSSGKEIERFSSITLPSLQARLAVLHKS